MKEIAITGTIGYGQGSKEYFDYMFSKTGEDEPVTIEISSLGGDFFTAVHIFSKIKAHKGPTTAIYTGLCASAATIIASACDTVKMYDTGAILIHDLSQYVQAYGQLKKEQIETLIKGLEKNVTNLKTLNDLAVSMYRKKTGKDEKFIKSLMEEDRWILHDEALEIGLVDNVIQDKEKGEVTAEIKIAASKTLNILNYKDMDLTKIISEFFKGKTQALGGTEAEELGALLSSEVKTEIDKLTEKVEAMEARQVVDLTEGIEARIATIEGRDSKISSLLDGFIKGVNSHFDAAIAKQEEKIEATVTQLQLKENTIVTGDASFEGKTPSTEQWIKQLENFK